MSSKMIRVRAKGMGSVRMLPPRAGLAPGMFFATFTELAGPARLGHGREAVVMLDGYEVAGLLHAIPGALVTDAADRQALTRVTCLLSRLAGGSKP